jgi:hypothetical protein
VVKLERPRPLDLLAWAHLPLCCHAEGQCGLLFLVAIMTDRTAEKSPVTENKDRNPLAQPRITNACEACRAAKVKCQASNQLGICRRYEAPCSHNPVPPHPHPIA